MTSSDGPTDLSAHVLSRTVERLSTAGSVEQVTEAVAGAVRQLLGADGATVVLREDDQCFYADEDAIGPMWKGQRFPADSCVSGWAMEHRRTVVIPDIYADDRVPHDAYRPTFVKSMVMTPIRSAAPIGALGAYWSDQHVTTPAQVRQLEVLANFTSVALENLELRSTVKRREDERDALEVAIHSLAHDLRNPVIAMMGYAELIEAEFDTEPTPAGPARTYARTIVAAGHRLSAQIDKMLMLYRVLDEPIEPEVMDLSALAREIGTELRGHVPGRAVRIEVADGLSALADPVLTRILLENLIGNAVKYSAKNAEALVEVGLAEGTENLFVVRDNGVGFDPGESDRLWQPMGRLHSDKEFLGSGLGLASVARIVALHGGTVAATARPGEGASFFFSLPPVPQVQSVRR